MQKILDFGLKRNYNIINCTKVQKKTKEIRMKKRLNYYNIFMTALFVVIAGLLLASGIVAIQKSMKLNLAVKMNPSISCKINASFDGGESYKEVFSNVEGDTAIGANWLISGNTLTYDNTAEGSMGMTVKLTVQNLTPNTKVMIESLDQVKDVVATNATSSAFDVAIPAGGKVAIDFSQVFAITKGQVNNATITPKSNVYTIDNRYYVKQNEEASFTLTGSGNYDTPAQGSIGLTSGSIKSYLNGTLTLNTLTSDTTITINNTTGKTYTVTKGTLTGFAWGAVADNAQFNSDYTFTLVLQDGYKIDGATVQAVITGESTVACEQTAVSGTTYTFKLAGASITGNVKINAVAEQDKAYTIYQYGDTANGAVAAPNDGWTGYSYIVFNDATTYNGYDLCWIIIGAGTTYHSLVPTTVSTARVDSTASDAELGADEILLLSEKILFEDAFQDACDSSLWKNSDLKPLLNGTFMDNSGLGKYAQEKTLKTTAENEKTGDETTDKIFLLAKGLDSENYCVETYLGTFTSGTPSSNLRMFLCDGAGYSWWWLRSGYYDDDDYAYYVRSEGYVYSGMSDGYMGVRPCFVMNLA